MNTTTRHIEAIAPFEEELLGMTVDQMEAAAKTATGARAKALAACIELGRTEE